jgi:glycosidase
MQGSKRIPVSRKFLIPTAAIFIVCCSISHFGCTEVKYNDLNARQSTEWVKNAVICEVNLRSFSKDGTFKALESKIPGWKKLGITIVSLMPIHPIGEFNRRGVSGSPNAVKDFYAVDPEFGTLEDFKSFVNSIHLQGLKIIIHLVVNQAAWDSRLLMEHPEWFVHNEAGAIISPDYESSDVAQIDYMQHEPRKYMIAMMKFWIQEIGIDGFQCRSAELVPTNFWEVARTELDKIKPILLISDGLRPEHHIKAFDLTYSWDMSYACPAIAEGKASASIINDSLNAESMRFPKGSLHLRFNCKDEGRAEDVPRIDKSRVNSERAIAILAFTLPGVPLISSGGQSGKSNQRELFTKLYMDLSALRQGHMALRYGSYENLQNSTPSRLFSFIRFSGRDSVLLVVNFADKKSAADIYMPAGASIMWKDQFSGVSGKVGNSRLNIAVEPFDFLALIPVSEKEMP